MSARSLRGESARYERPSTEKEAAILAAATSLFGAKGYRGARTADIAARAGVTERTLFRYFPSKDQLYRRVMFPAVLAATMPRELTETGKLFALDSNNGLLALKVVARLFQGQSGPNTVYTWTGPSALQSSLNVTGTYNDISGAASGFSTNSSSGTRFFRLRR